MIKLSKIDGTELWQLEQDLVVKGYFTVPRFFITDLASVPSWLRGIVDNSSDDIVLPSIAHDFSYHKDFPHKWQRKTCDLMLYKLCLRHNMPEWKANAVYYAVRWGGASNFRK